MIRSYSTAMSSLMTVYLYLSSLVIIISSTTNAQQLQRIVNQTTVATSVTSAVNQFLVSDYGRNKDILAGGSAGVVLYPNLGFGNFGTAQVITGGNVECMCDGDFNGDGLADFVYAVDDSSATLRVALQNAVTPGTFDMSTIMTATSLVLPTSGATLMRPIGRNVKVADMDGDGYYDIIATVNGAGDSDALKGALVYLRNTGDGINYETTILAEDLGGIALLKLADLDGDDRVDIVVVGVDSRQVAVYYNEKTTPGGSGAVVGGGGGNFTKLVLDQSAESNLCIAIGDFNNYGNPDILAIGSTTIHFYLNNFGRNFQKWDMFDYIHEENMSTDYHHFSCALYDIDGNGLTDIVYTQGLQGKITEVSTTLDYNGVLIFFEISAALYFLIILTF
jgi:FG-GAP-like repeat